MHRDGLSKTQNHMEDLPPGFRFFPTEESNHMEDLPPGFRFFPTEEELVSFYLYNKLEGRKDLNRVMERIIPVLDIYEFDPADLPQISREMCSIRDTEQWFFFMARQESEARGGRPKRLTTNGYWKATGSPGNVYSNNRCIGVKRTMVFYKGRAPNGTKTEWKMNEYKLVIQEDQASSSSTDANPRLRHEFSLCRVYKKSKCLRSFDRRPVGRLTEIGEMMRGQPGAEGGHQATTSSQNLQVGERLMSCSPDSSSSSGDQGNPDAPMSVDDETFLDWKQLDSWFAGGDDSQPK